MQSENDSENQFGITPAVMMSIIKMNIQKIKFEKNTII